PDVVEHHGGRQVQHHLERYPHVQGQRDRQHGRVDRMLQQTVGTGADVQQRDERVLIAEQGFDQAFGRFLNGLRVQNEALGGGLLRNAPERPAQHFEALLLQFGPNQFRRALVVSVPDIDGFDAEAVQPGDKTGGQALPAPQQNLPARVAHLSRHTHALAYFMGRNELHLSVSGNPCRFPPFMVSGRTGQPFGGGGMNSAATTGRSPRTPSWGGTTLSYPFFS